MTCQTDPFGHVPLFCVRYFDPGDGVAALSQMLISLVAAVVAAVAVPAAGVAVLVAGSGPLSASCSSLAPVLTLSLLPLTAGPVDLWGSSYSAGCGRWSAGSTAGRYCWADPQ